MSACGICGLPLHFGDCKRVLIAEVARLRNQLAENQAHPTVAQPTRVNGSPKRDRAAYYRAYRATKRAMQ